MSKKLSIEYTCEVCASIYNPWKHTSRTCSFQCANTLRSRESADLRAEKLRKPVVKHYRKRRGRLEHHVVAEEKIGRPLRSGEVVHHINGDKMNNDPDNLEVLPSQSVHAKMHNINGRFASVKA